MPALHFLNERVDDGVEDGASIVDSFIEKVKSRAPIVRSFSARYLYLYNNLYTYLYISER